MRPFVTYYDLQFQSKDYGGEVTTALAFLELNLGARILEIGAGTGGHSLALARRGMLVTAVEIDPEMAALGAVKTAEIPAIQWHVGSAETSSQAAVDGACALFYVINYIRTRRDLVGLLAAVRHRLPEGKRFIFDCWNGVEAMRTAMPVSRQIFELPGGGNLAREIVTHVDMRRQEAELVYNLDIRPAGDAAVESTERLTIRLWTRRELEEVLEEMSFRVMHVRDGRAPNKDADAESARLWIAAKAV